MSDERMGEPHLWETWDSSAWRGQGSGISPLYINACRKGAQRTVRVFSVMPSDRQEQKLKHGRLSLNTRKCFFTLVVTGIAFSKSFWNLQFFRISVLWRRSQTNCFRQLHLSSFGQGNLQRFLQPFCSSVIIKFPTQTNLKLQVKFRGMLFLSYLCINLDANRKSGCWGAPHRKLFTKNCWHKWSSPCLCIIQPYRLFFSLQLHIQNFFRHLQWECIT